MLAFRTGLTPTLRLLVLVGVVYGIMELGWLPVALLTLVDVSVVTALTFGQGVRRCFVDFVCGC